MISRIHHSLAALRRAANRYGLAARFEGDEVILYPKPKFSGKFTDAQCQTQELMGLASLAWKLLTPKSRNAWDLYGERFERFFERESVERLTGWRLFTGATARRIMLGADPPDGSPLMAPPPPPPGHLEILPVGTGTQSEDAAAAATFTFRVHHSCPMDGVMMLVRATPPSLTPLRKPQRGRSILIRGYHPASAAALPPSGATVTFENCRVSVEPGQRFGVWISFFRIQDGIASSERFFDLVR